jgi:hypothetical protein
MKKYILISLLLFLFHSNSFSQELNSLPGRVKVLYSANKVRAKAIQQLLNECILYYENARPAFKFNITSKLLTQDEWETLPYEIPYGMPHYNGEFIIIPSDKKATGELLTGKPDLTPDSLLSHLDAISVHELGHYYFMTLLKADTTSMWTNEFMAQYFVAAFYLDTNKTFNSPVDEMVTYKPKHRTLEDFEELYDKMDPMNYGWYQGQFFKLALALYPKLKLQLLEEYVNKGTEITLLEALKKIAKKETNIWLTEMQ